MICSFFINQKCVVGSQRFASHSNQLSKQNKSLGGIQQREVSHFTYETKSRCVLNFYASFSLLYWKIITFLWRLNVEKNSNKNIYWLAVETREKRRKKNRWESFSFNLHEDGNERKEKNCCAEIFMHKLLSALDSN